jgi:rhodanese-related sulfurtransferase
MNTISVDKLARLIGTPNCPALVGVRTDDDHKADPRLIPGSMPRPYADVSAWTGEFTSRSAIAICQSGAKPSEGAAAWLRHGGVSADALEDGFEGWRKAGLSGGHGQNATTRRPQTHRLGDAGAPQGRSHCVSVADPSLRGPPRRVPVRRPRGGGGVAERFSATPFDVEGVSWGHRGDTCTFDVMVEEFGLATEPLLRLAAIVRGADTGRMDIAPHAAGLLAASLGLSRMYADDLAQLEAGMTLYDAFYRWCRDATDETHTWHSKRPGA